MVRQEYYTPDELDQIRAEMRAMSAEVRRVLEERGHKVDPRIVAQREKAAEIDPDLAAFCRAADDFDNRVMVCKDCLGFGCAPSDWGRVSVAYPCERCNGSGLVLKAKDTPLPEPLPAKGNPYESLSLKQIARLVAWLNGLDQEIRDRFASGDIKVEFEFDHSSGIGVGCDAHLVCWNRTEHWHRIGLSTDITDYESW